MTQLHVNKLSPLKWQIIGLRLQLFGFQHTEQQDKAEHGLLEIMYSWNTFYFRRQFGLYLFED